MIENLLKKNLTRLEILKCEDLTKSPKEVYITVYRNHSFEHMEGMINKFLNYSNLTAKFSYSDYDDSFNFIPAGEKNDLNIIWIDFSRYNNIDIPKWISERLDNLVKISSKPVLLYYTGHNELNIKKKNVVLANTKEIEKELEEDFYDYEKFEYSGTNLSSKASIKVAQELGLKYLPSFFQTPLKAIVVDMDNTFYKGIIGEDGIDSVEPNIEFQKQLKKLKDKGVLLSIASKNELEDVKKLFEKRTDFILNWNDFSSHNISWKSKDHAIIDTAKQFNIGLDSILFIDDNIGEINYIHSSLPNVKTLIADKDLTYKLNIYPLLQRYLTSNEDKLRSSDIEANQKRNEMFATMDIDEYFKSLEMHLSYTLDMPENFERSIQLINKTNQFIFSYKRYKADEITPNQHILTISLKDKLSDSGIIGIIVASKQDNSLKIDECVVSCRALGRNIEDYMLDGAFMYLSERLNTSKNLIIDFKIGERNNPAKHWLEKYSETKISKDTVLTIPIKNIEPNKNLKMEYPCNV